MKYSQWPSQQNLKQLNNPLFAGRGNTFSLWTAAISTNPPLLLVRALYLPSLGVSVIEVRFVTLLSTDRSKWAAQHCLSYCYYEFDPVALFSEFPQVLLLRPPIVRWRGGDSNESQESIRFSPSYGEYDSGYFRNFNRNKFFSWNFITRSKFVLNTSISKQSITQTKRTDLDSHTLDCTQA